MENNKLKELAQEFFDKCIIFQGVDDQLKAFRVENLYNFLADNQWKFYSDYQKKSLFETVYYELENRDFEVDEIPQNIIDEMAMSLEERIYDEDRFSSIIEVVFDDYAEDLQEYAVEE